MPEARPITPMTAWSHAVLSLSTPVVSRRSVREALANRIRPSSVKSGPSPSNSATIWIQLLAGQIKRDTADAIYPSQKARSGQPVVELHDLLFHPPAVGMGKRIGGVIAHRPDVAQIVGETLELRNRVRKYRARRGTSRWRSDSTAWQ